MTSIAQRRVAGATALMILLYLLQVALFSPPGMAAVTLSETNPGPGATCPEAGGWSSHQSDASDDTVGGAFGEIEFTSNPEKLTVTLDEGYVMEICVKQGPGYQLFTVTYEDDDQQVPLPQTVWDGDLSHWGYKVTVSTTTLPTTTVTSEPTTTVTSEPTTTVTTAPPTTVTSEPETVTFDSLPEEDEEVEILGTTITTAPEEVAADTLPFTGFEAGDTARLALLALLAGGLMVFAVRGPREREEAADLGGWSTF